MELTCFQSQWAQLKNGTPVFSEKFFVFQKIWFKVKVLKTFETFTDCHIKTCRSLKRRAILKIPSTKFCRKNYWKKQQFIFTVYLMKSRFSDICTIKELKEFNWLCKQMKNVRSRQPCISMIFWIGRKFFHLSIVKSKLAVIHQVFLQIYLPVLPIETQQVSRKTTSHYLNIQVIYQNVRYLLEVLHFGTRFCQTLRTNSKKINCF